MQYLHSHLWFYLGFILFLQTHLSSDPYAFTDLTHVLYIYSEYQGREEKIKAFNTVVTVTVK